MLTAYVKDLLEKTAVAIEQNPARVNMGHWESPRWSTRFARCGTTYCIADWLLMQASGGPLTCAPLEIEGLAVELLGLTEDQRLRLFYVPNWPAQFRDNNLELSEESAFSALLSRWYLYGNPVAGTPEYARRVAARIRFFSATEGTDKPEYRAVEAIVEAEPEPELCPA